MSKFNFNSNNLVISTTTVLSVRFLSIDYQVSEADGSVNVGVDFGATESEVIVGLIAVPNTATS